MTENRWRRQLLAISTLSAGCLWQGMDLAVAAGNQLDEPDFAPAPHGGPDLPPDMTGIFGGLMTTDLVLCAVAGVFLFLCLILFVLYLRQSSSIKRLHDEQRKMRRELDDLHNKLTQMHNASRQDQYMADKSYDPDDRVAIIAGGHRVQQARQYEQASLASDTTNRPPMPSAVGRPAPAAVVEDFLAEYNRFMNQSLTGLAMKQAREALIAKYRVRTFSCQNAAERAYQPTMAPDYQSVETGGDYWALQISEREGCYVVPNPKVTYESQIHGAGGMKEAFASNYHGGSFGHIKVIIPARFTCVNNHWTVLAPGKIEVY